MYARLDRAICFASDWIIALDLVIRRFDDSRASLLAADLQIIRICKSPFITFAHPFFHFCTATRHTPPATSTHFILPTILLSSLSTTVYLKALSQNPAVIIALRPR